MLVDISDGIRNGGFFSINLRWVDSKLQDHTDFIELHATDSIDANPLASSIKNVLIKLNLPLSNYRR